MLPFLRKPFRVVELMNALAATGRANPLAGDTLLEAALRNSWLELWYQPKVDLKSMKICGAEALVRLRHPERGIVDPRDFLPPTGDPLYQPLTDFVVRRALADWSSFVMWPPVSAGWSTNRLAINVPASILQTREFVDNVRRHLPTHPQFPGLIVEITEDEAVGDPELAREIAIQLKLYGIHVSIDDFGAGYSRFSRLDEMPFAELKLDRHYVDGCSADVDKHSMCQTVVDLAHRFNLTAVAEGVETAADLRTLIAMGYDMAQGYYLGRPMERQAFAEMLDPPSPGAARRPGGRA
jgi:EAL domain-containing protein (putative c-di-GMP-specific phosphodiesterase class I)